MTRTRWLLALICLLVGCAEGGSRGTGISSAVAGNVESVQVTAPPSPARRAAGAHRSRLSALFAVGAAASTATPLDGISVSIEGTAVQGQTDAQGRFALRGDFEGQATLLFERTADGLTARLAIDVPAAGSLTLTNIHIDAVHGDAVAQSEAAQFDGIITGVYCGDFTITMRSVQQSPTDLDRYTVRLDTSSLHDSRGAALTCGELHTGERAGVQAVVDTDGSLSNATITVEE